MEWSSTHGKRRRRGMILQGGFLQGNTVRREGRGHHGAKDVVRRVAAWKVCSMEVQGELDGGIGA